MIASEPASVPLSPTALERRFRLLAAVDVIASPEWEHRWFSFNVAWDASAGERMGAFRDGEGDELFALWSADHRLALKGFAHESAAARRLLADPDAARELAASMPLGSASFIAEPAFEFASTTFVGFSAPDAAELTLLGLAVPVSGVSAAGDADGRTRLLAPFLWSAHDHCAYLAGIHELTAPDTTLVAIHDLFAKPAPGGRYAVSTEWIRSINPYRDLDELMAELDEVGVAIGD